MTTLYPKTESQERNYQLLIDIIPFYLNPEDYIETNLANFVALVNYYTEELNWCGVYLSRGEYLVLSSFQGLPACTKIEKGKGVCGTAFMNKKTVLVKDVRLFEGHISCDDKTQSELAIPFFYNKNVFGILDLDSPIISRFKRKDQKYLEIAIKQFEKIISQETA